MRGPGSRIGSRIVLSLLVFGQLLATAPAEDRKGAVEATDSELPAVAEAFARLDALQRDLAAWRQALSGGSGEAPFSIPAVAEDEGVPLSTGEVSSAPSRMRDVSCDSREKIDDNLGEIEERHAEAADTIIDANQDLRNFRAGLLNLDEICEPRLADGIASAETRLLELDIETDRTATNEISICIDRLRKRTDNDLKQADSSIRMRRLAAEMEGLIAVTERAMELERALLRGRSKRDRIVQELRQFQQEIENACL